MTVSRPPCRCAERRQAMARAAIALARGDVTTWREESEFVRRTLAEDTKAYRDWLVTTGNSGPSHISPEMLEELRLDDERFRQQLISRAREGFRR